MLHPEQIWLLPQHTVYSVCSYLPGVCRQLILNVSGAEAAGQGVQKSRQREEMQRAIRDSGQRHHELQLQIPRGESWRDLLVKLQ